MPKHKLHNKGQLAKELGVNRDFITRMCFAGFEMPGGRSTIAWAHQWLKANPSFTPARPRKPRKQTTLP